MGSFFLDEKGWVHFSFDEKGWIHFSSDEKLNIAVP